jgi:hypothetical protein
MANKKPNTSGLVSFRKGYDPRREGNGRKPYADLIPTLSEKISAEEIASILADEARKGNIRALQEIFRIVGAYAQEGSAAAADEHIVLRFTDAEPYRQAEAETA